MNGIDGHYSTYRHLGTHRTSWKQVFLKQKKLILSQTLISAQQDKIGVHIFKTLIPLGNLEKHLNKDVLNNYMMKMIQNWSMSMPHTEEINTSSSGIKR